MLCELWKTLRTLAVLQSTYLIPLSFHFPLALFPTAVPNWCFLKGGPTDTQHQETLVCALKSQLPAPTLDFLSRELWGRRESVIITLPRFFLCTLKEEPQLR